MPRALILDHKEPQDEKLAAQAKEASSLRGTLISQCNHIISRGKRRGQRCRHLTDYDYRRCEEHLRRDWHVAVRPSNIRHAGLGLFAVDPEASCDCDCVQRRRVVFRKGDLIGCFAGELIGSGDFQRRYSNEKHNNFAPYVLGVDDDKSHDESYARTAFSYANDGVNLKDPLLRRNYVYKTGSHVVWHQLEWPHVVNAYCDSNSEGRPSLYALGDICHGEEILWSYSGSLNPSKNDRGEWVLDASRQNSQPQDSYFYGLLELSGGSGGSAGLHGSTTPSTISTVSGSRAATATS
jgi:hypothetical protein